MVEKVKGIIPLLIIILLLVLFLIFCIRMIFITSKTSKEAKKNRKQKLRELNATVCEHFFHTMGLPLPEKTFCQLYLCAEKIIIEANGFTFNLPKEKIQDVSIKTDKEIHKQYVSSIGGAVGGAFLFGPLGAMIGGRVKEKKSTKITDYLIFTYEKEGNPAFIAFEIPKASRADKFVKDFRINSNNINKANKTIEL
ncbi:hypothetical protein GND95_08640 [Defluviitalea raffinosedens]|uniref:Uncharacterized protein n=1 Tax=Defluviitalea raffinosedens TaxID=1450156 RepID=A0A7C8LHI4_9FIRM|nr:hypothetical protein [Defluviitalea raffinosedens]KAE9633713.1 hypothetical protein GND95_08640 [Defluviitalea raffinosedens]